jgi:hypothetical protein
MHENGADTIARLADEYNTALARLMAENRDFSTRAEQRGGTIYYDPGEDLLILFIGEPCDALTIDADEVFSLRYDPATWEIRAVEIPSLRAFVAAHPEAAMIMQTLARLAQQAPCTLIPVPPAQMLQVANDLPELVPA